MIQRWKIQCLPNERVMWDHDKPQLSSSSSSTLNLCQNIKWMISSEDKYGLLRSWSGVEKSNVCQMSASCDITTSSVLGWVVSHQMQLPSVYFQPSVYFLAKCILSSKCILSAKCILSGMHPNTGICHKKVCTTHTYTSAYHKHSRQQRYVPGIPREVHTTNPQMHRGMFIEYKVTEGESKKQMLQRRVWWKRK